MSYENRPGTRITWAALLSPRFMVMSGAVARRVLTAVFAVFVVAVVVAGVVVFLIRIALLVVVAPSSAVGVALA